MLESHFATRRDRIYFNSLASYAGVIDWLDDQGFLGDPAVDSITSGIDRI